MVQKVLKAYRIFFFSSVEKKSMETGHHNTSFGHKKNSLNYPGIRPENLAGHHLPDMPPVSRIFIFSRSQISSIQLSGRITIRCFPTKNTRRKTTKMFVLQLRLFLSRFTYANQHCMFFFSKKSILIKLTSAFKYI